MSKKEKKIKLNIPTEEQKEEVKKERKTISNGFKFFALTVAAVVLLVLSILIFIFKSLATKITIVSIGFVIVAFGLVRLIPLMRSNKISSKSKLVYGLEITIDTIVGVILVALGLKIEEQTEGLFIVDYFRFFVGSIFYLKGIFYFITTSLLNDKTNKLEFWVHIFIMTLGIVLFAIKFNAVTIAYILAGLFILISLLLIFYSSKAYKKYRGGVDGGKAKKEEEKVEVQEKPVEEEIIQEQL